MNFDYRSFLVEHMVGGIVVDSAVINCNCPEDADFLAQHFFGSRAVLRVTEVFSTSLLDD